MEMLCIPKPIPMLNDNHHICEHTVRRVKAINLLVRESIIPSERTTNGQHFMNACSAESDIEEENVIDKFN